MLFDLIVCGKQISISSCSIWWSLEPLETHTMHYKILSKSNPYQLQLFQMVVSNKRRNIQLHVNMKNTSVFIVFCHLRLYFNISLSYFSSLFLVICFLCRMKNKYSQLPAINLSFIIYACNMLMENVHCVRLVLIYIICTNLVFYLFFFLLVRYIL